MKKLLFVLLCVAICGCTSVNPSVTASCTDEYKIDKKNIQEVKEMCYPIIGVSGGLK